MRADDKAKSEFQSGFNDESVDIRIAAEDIAE